MKRLSLFLVLIAALLAAQQGDRWRGVDPHDVPACDIPPRAAKSPETVKPCTCIGMVEAVRRAQARKCWDDAGMIEPPQGLAWMLATDAVRECLSQIPDHCEVIASVPSSWGYKGKHRCGTECKPERCKCPDHPCKSHEASGDY